MFVPFLGNLKIMEVAETIRRLIFFPEIMMILMATTWFILPVSGNFDQATWETCRHETFHPSWCVPGTVRRNHSECSLRKPCCPCPAGTFMDQYNNCTTCMALRDCEAEGREVLFAGSAEQDAECGDIIMQSTTEAVTTSATTVDATSLSSKTKDTPLNSTTPSDDKDGTTVIKHHPGTLVILATSVVFLLIVVGVFICFPGIPSKLNSMLPSYLNRSNRIIKRNAIPMQHRARNSFDGTPV